MKNANIEKELEKAISDKYGFEVPVIVRNKKELETSVKNNPFFDENADINYLYLTFLKEVPSKENIEKTLTYNYEPDRFVIIDKDVFIYCEGKYHKTKLNNNFFEKKLKVGATTRNWKTILKLLELSDK